MRYFSVLWFLFSNFSVVAHGTKTQRKDFRNEPLDVDAVDDVVEESISGSDATAPSTSSNYKPMTRYCPNHHDSPGSVFGSKPYKARAQNLGITSTVSKYSGSTQPYCGMN